jgi:D-alanyl-D-alanine carboxypeptidase
LTAALLVLLSVPLIWLMLQQTATPSVRPVASPHARALSLPAEPGDPDYEPAGRTCDDPKVLVDRAHGLPADYAPDDLVSLRQYGVPTLGGDALLRREAAEHLGRMVVAAAVEGEELAVASAYRSYEDQRLSYGRLVSIYGAGANNTSAAPGHSQHQLGTAVDFTNAAVGYEVHRSFGRTTASWWLLRHAHEHGFVLAYPPGREAETGYRWEPWHYRYIGVQDAVRLRRSGLDLQGFLTQEGLAPRC